VKPTIAIVGASTRAAAASAVRAGFQPITADLFADEDLRRIATTTRISPYPEGLLDWLRAMDPPAWMYTGALENHPELVDQMAWIAPLWGNPGDVLQRVRSPWELQNALRNAGLLFPETRVSSDDLPLDGSWLVKTYRGASGSGVRELTTPLPFREGQGEGSPVVFQRRVTGTPCAAVFAAMDDIATLIGVTRQLVGESWLGSHGFQYAGSIGSLPISDAVERTVRTIGEVLTQSFELSGLFGVDFVLDGDDIWTIEVNPRYTASVEICERATGTHALKLHVVDWPDARVNSLNAHANASPLMHGKAILFAKRGIVLTEEFSQMALTEALQKPWPTLADVSPAGSLVDVGRPILTVFAEGADVVAVEKQLKRRVVEIEQLVYGEGER
jgi:predicted ATP-grasp superfamily ATP-dependent carboligase